MSKKFLVLVLVITLLVPFISIIRVTKPAFAQTPPGEWEIPINLSHSGSTENPAIIMDNKGTPFVLWRDTDTGFLYSRLENDVWTPPQEADFPFDRSSPRKLMADDRGYIYAFWMNNKDELLYSYVPAIGFNKKFLWSRLQVLGQAVKGYHVTQDVDGFFHIAYIRTSEDNNQPAGVYYRKTRGAGYPWTANVRIYESRYLRSLDTRNAHVWVSATEVEEKTLAFVAWDNPPLRQVFISKSSDGGTKWDDPTLVDGPSELSPDASPFNIVVQANGMNVVLLWQSGLQSGFDCTQYSQYSTDLGNKWTIRQEMFDQLPGCPQEQVFFKIDDYQVLMTTIQDQVYLIAWNGKEWSTPQLQSPLSSFNDPEIFSTILLGCRRAILVDRKLFVVGCEAEGDGDIWLLSRPLNDVSAWFGEALQWQSPFIISDGQVNIGSTSITCDPEGRRHIVWTQSLLGAESIFDTAIYYAGQDRDVWVGPTHILSTRDSRAVQTSLTLDGNNHILATWGDSRSGSVFFSIAQTELAHNAFNWFEPVRLPAIQPAAVSPDILVSRSGRILIVYAISINDDRGIYLVASDDEGKTWIPPIKVFDAVSQEWFKVDQPKLAQTDDGVLHMVWTRNPLPSADIAEALFYSRSLDDGQTWSEPQLVVDEPLRSGRIVAAGNVVHRFWLSLGKISGLWHDYSNDSGNTWNQAINMTGLGENTGNFAVVSDRASSLHLIQATKYVSGVLALKYSVWNGVRWSTVEDFNIDQIANEYIGTLSACIEVGDRLSVVYSLRSDDAYSSRKPENVFITSRALEASANGGLASAPTNPPTNLVLITPLVETPEPTLQPSQAPSATPEIALATGTAIASSVDATGGQQQPAAVLDTSWFGPALGLGLAVIVIVLAITLRIRKMRSIDRYYS